MSTKRNIINKVIGIEGGYVNDKADSGGETKYGITHAVASRHGYGVRSLTPEQAYQIYEQDYWHPLQLDIVLLMSERLAEELFDTAVNTGNSRAVQFLQRSLNGLNDNGRRYPDITIDGVLGQQTIDALTRFLQQRGQSGEAVLFNMLNSLQATFYLELAERRPKDERFNYGWQKNRVQRIEEPDDAVNTSVAPTFSTAQAAPAPTFSAPQTTPTPTFNKLSGKKTYLVALITAGLGIAEYFGINIPEFVYVILGSLGLTTLRMGIGMVSR